MHSKLKGNIGEAAIIKDLATKGYLVFKEIGDLSKIDLIAEKDNKLLKIQVKAVTSENGEIITLDKRKSGPNYSFSYTCDMVDIFAVYVLDLDIVAYISAKELCKNNSSTVLRLKEVTNGQKARIRYLKDYHDLDKCILDVPATFR